MRALRQSAGLTIEALSEASGVSGRAISDVERGRSRAPQERTLAALADALGLGDGDRADLVESARAERSGNRVGRPRLYELPRGLGDFVGRVPELALLRRLGQEAWADDLTPVVVVHGQAGLGKTACAVRAAELLREVFPDGQFYIDLRGTDAEPTAATEALSGLLKALGVNPQAIADEEQERASQLRATLRERRYLLVLDNARDEAQVRPLLPGRGAGMVMVTSRRTLAGLQGVSRIALAPLAAEESAELLRAIVGDASHRAGCEELAEVVRLCGNLPLALRIAGTLLASRSGWTMRHLADRLADEDRRLATLTIGDLGVEAAFALSYAALSPHAKMTFRRLALVPGWSFAAPIAAVLTEMEPFAAEDQLDELVELGLLQCEGADRYRFHDLIRLFAEQRLREEEPHAVRTAIETRMADRLLETAMVAGRWFEPEYGSPPPGWRGLVPLATEKEAQGWLRAEADNWLGALRLAAIAGRNEQVVELAEAMNWYSDQTEHWSGHWVEVFQLSRAAAAQLPDRRREIAHINAYAWAVLGQKRGEDSAALAMEAYRLAEIFGDVKEQANAVFNAGEAWRFDDGFRQALWAYSRAQKLADSAGDHIRHISACTGMAIALAGLGKVDEALEQFQAALRAVEARPVPPASAKAVQMIARQHLARTLADAQRWQEAIDVAMPALAEADELRWLRFIGHIHLTLGRAHAGLGDPGRAREHLASGLEVLEGHGGAAHDETIRSAKAMLAEL